MSQGFVNGVILGLPVGVTLGGTGLSSTTINQILYSSSNNVIAGLPTGNSGVLVTSAGGVPSISSTLPAFTTSSITFSPTTGGIVGTTTNDNTAAGKVGEYIRSSVLSASAVAVTSTVSANITSISLTAGDWDVSGSVVTKPALGTTVQYCDVAISQTSATLPILGAENNFAQIDAVIANVVSVMCVGSMRISLSGTTTIYLVGNCQFSVSTMALYGFIGARRVR